MRLFGGKTAEEVTHGIDGTGLTAIITGASRGIGLETTRVLALRGVHVVMAVRNMIAGNEAKDKLLLELPSAKIDVMELDLSSLASVRKFASQFLSSYLPLNLLVNNAGVLASSFTLSHDNIELHFATNHLGHFLLTNLLLDTMKKTARTSGREGRIVNVSSMAHKFTYSEGIRFDKLNDPPGRQTYPQSKLANILHSNELTKRLKDEGVSVTANSVDPGSINTDLFRNSGIIRMIANVFFKGVQEGAATSCYVVLHQEVNGLSGKYFTGCKLTNPSRQAQDAVLAQRLWDFSMDLIK